MDNKEKLLRHLYAHKGEGFVNVAGLFTEYENDEEGRKKLSQLLAELSVKSRAIIEVVPQYTDVTHIFAGKHAHALENSSLKCKLTDIGEENVENRYLKSKDSPANNFIVTGHGNTVQGVALGNDNIQELDLSLNEIAPIPSPITIPNISIAKRAGQWIMKHIVAVIVTGVLIGLILLWIEYKFFQNPAKIEPKPKPNSTLQR